MFQFPLFLIFLLISVAKSQDINDTCVDLSFDKLNNDFQSAFLNVAEIPIYDYAKVMYQVENSVGEISYDISVRWKKPDVENKRTRTYFRDINLVQHWHGHGHGHGHWHLSKVSEGKVLCNLSHLFKKTLFLSSSREAFAKRKNYAICKKNIQHQLLKV